jgi:carboxyl-terminal processing protease
MKIRGRHLILLFSGPFVLYAVLGGFLGRVLARDSAYRYLSVFQDVVTLIMNNYVDPVRMDRVIEGAIRGMMDALDPDSSYLSPDEFAEFQNPKKTGLADIGVEVTKRYYLQVVAVLPGSSGEEAGLRPGDLLKSVDGHNTRDLSVAIGESLFEGTPGSNVELQVIRGRQPEPIELTITREVYSGDPVAYKMLTDSIGYIRIAEFRNGGTHKVARAVQQLTREGASELVVDVRNSFGRSAEEGARTGELFIPGGVAATLGARDGEKTELEMDPGRVIFKGRLALLVNWGSSGAAEILASAVGHAKRGELVGGKTSGRSGVQKLIALGDGSGLVLSVSQYWTPDGKPLIGQGLEPTVEVQEPSPSENGEGDPVLEKAIEILSESKTDSKVAA